jgi:hypothetical protein
MTTSSLAITSQHCLDKIREERFRSDRLMHAQAGAAFCGKRKWHARRHMNLLSILVAVKASPTSTPISEIARSMAPRDVLRCGVMLCRAKLDCGE